MRHCFEAHASEFNFSFSCRIDSCPRSFNTLSSFQSHVSRKHPNSQPPPVPINVLDEEGDTGRSSQSDTEDLSDGQQDTPTDSEDTDSEDPLDSVNPGPHSYDGAQKSAALFLLRMKEQHRLTQVSIDFVVSHMNGIISSVMQSTQEKVCDSIRGQLTDVQMETDPPDVSSCFAPVNPFEGLETEHKQLKFYRDHFNLVVSLESSIIFL